MSIHTPYRLDELSGDPRIVEYMRRLQMVPQ
jgi:hypothetical protein